MLSLTPRGLVTRVTLLNGLLLLLIASFTINNAAADRGRVKIVNKDLRSDQGTPLRGTHFFLDIFSIDDMRNNESTYRNYFRSVAKDYNMNLVRTSVYFGDFEIMQKDSPYYQSNLRDFKYVYDKVVQWAAEDGVYVIIIMGTKHGSKIQLDRAKDFWNVFAPRYKNRSHVIYELVNEPNIPAIRRTQAPLYKHVRSLAPKTHLIFWSLTNPEDMNSGDIWNHSGGIDYGNASVGFHIYDFILNKSQQWDLAKAYRRNGLPVINTEFYSLTRADYYPIDYNFLGANVRMAEDRGFSWTQFAPVANYRFTNKRRGDNNRTVTHQDIAFSQRYWNKLAEYGTSKWARDGQNQNNQNNQNADNDQNAGTSLQGVRRLSDTWQGHQLHASGQYAGAGVQSAPFRGEWSSQQWLLEAQGDYVFRIKNQWTGRYLAPCGDWEWADLCTLDYNASWSSLKWKFEWVDNSWRIKNLWTQKYITAPSNQWENFRLANRRDNWTSQIFTVK